MRIPAPRKDRHEGHLSTDFGTVGIVNDKLWGNALLSGHNVKNATLGSNFAFYVLFSCWTFQLLLAIRTLSCKVRKRPAITKNKQRVDLRMHLKGLMHDLWRITRNLGL